MSEEVGTGLVRGACFCEAVQYEIEMPTRMCVHCHCTMCRRLHGSAYTTWVILPSRQLHILSGKEKLTHYASSDHGSRDFCSVCGSELFGWSTRTPDLAYTVLANLEGEIDRDPEAHLGFDTRVPWVAIDDDLPRIEGVGLLETESE